MDTITLPKAVEDFVAATNAHDVDALVAVFADGASVRDDGNSATGAAEIRDWIQVHLVTPKIVLTPTSFAGDRMVASSDGDFPGGPLPFGFVFGIDNDQITSLVVDPA